MENYLNSIPKYEFTRSEYADTRCVSRGCLSDDEELYATAGWGGDCKVWNIKDCSLAATLKGHTDRVICIKFHPEHGSKSLDPGACGNLVSCSADRTVRLWALDLAFDYQKSEVLKGHEDTVNFAEFHPMGRYVASTSHDMTWRLWDAETKQCILVQEGHSGPVYPLSFQQDGSLLATGDLHGIGLLWDLRTGKKIMDMPPFQGTTQLTALQFLPSAYQLASGGDSNCV